ncbi:MULTISPECIES: LacI family DNA-binding transcriptional regulator [Paenibacillus]|uniref:LacI family DNA-binding transcriptional regulator n=1 Tax=Paenibacillus campinasensis TaxID=66347 RepID=A0A268F1K8_9BACL|nr:MULTISPECIES: LacI family DNA-binding transcriptional regulator [Paenibacillus]MUG65696.1 LacI family DNA-binding transcriptional regulator [Paenibacillus campinasensis]PAD79266.1 LacI family transcriptional regulator [Paenibacillus campinasensis]PAK54260.1 LacI family transcriptional regulator [Paenibacillus sp. 7541]
MSTIRDVAKLANVSTATVSRVLNNDTKYKITEETKERVWQAVTQLNYKISSKPKRKASAKEPAEAKSQIKIGCVLSVTKDKYNDPYFMSILSGVEERLLSRGYSIAFIRTGIELNDHQILSSTFNEPITGLILMESLNRETYEYIRKQVPYIVGIDTERGDIDNVGYDHYNVASVAVNHLIEKGHTQIGYIGGSGLTGNLKDSRRYRGYYASMHAAGLSVNPDWVIDCMWDEAVCTENINRLCTSGNVPTAFFAGSDLMAMAALNALYSSGISVPNDVAVIGLSNIEVSKYSNPPLSTIDVPTKEIGMVAVDNLLDRINGNQLLPKKVILPTRLVVRSST